MQRYSISHRTRYDYSAPVQLAAHHLLLRPREDYQLRLESFVLNITPAANLLWHRDVEGNSVAIATFSQSTQQLLIESQLVIQQYNQDPLDFLVSDYAVDYPFEYMQEDNYLLSLYRSLPDMATQQQIWLWIGTFWHPTEAIQTYSLLQRLTESIFNEFTYGVREAAGVQTAKFTLQHGSGCCRDFAWLFVLAARCLGLAARFVSGYLHDPLLPNESGATHAWAEVYLPGAGWKGFDPTIGKMAGRDHIAVAVARMPDAVPPIAGAFSGIADASMQVDVRVCLL